MGQPDRAVGKEHRRQGDVQRERRVVAPAEAAAAYRRNGMSMCAGGTARRASPSRYATDFRRLVGRLHAENELEFLAARVVPAQAAFRLEKHRIDRLGVELTIQHEERRIVRGQLRADLLAEVAPFGIVSARSASATASTSGPRCSGFVELAGTDPAVLERRVDVGRLGRRPADAGESKGAVVRHRDRSGLLAELDERLVAQREARLIEGVEVFEHQQRDRLAEIEGVRRRAEEIAGIERGNARADLREISAVTMTDGFSAPLSSDEIEAGVHMRRVRRPDQHARARSATASRAYRRRENPTHRAWPRDLGDAVDATGPGRGRVPPLPSRHVSRMANAGSSAAAKRVRVRPMPLAAPARRNSRRETTRSLSSARPMFSAPPQHFEARRQPIRAFFFWCNA